MNKRGKTILGAIGSIVAVNLISGLICNYCEKIEEKKEAERMAANKSSDNPFDAFEPITRQEMDTKWLDNFTKKMREHNERAELESVRKVVMYLYAVIKQRKTLMKSEEEFLTAAIRQNKLIDGEIDLENCTDQELIRYLETKCKFDISDNTPKLISEKKAIAFVSLKDLGIDSI